jgi:diketogulonate reductase-like aldo/keto reductase
MGSTLAMLLQNEGSNPVPALFGGMGLLGFSLLTANRALLHNPLIVSLAESANITPAQVVFSFARDIGTLPLTGTSNAEHMKQDLASRDLTLPPEAVQAIESLAG